MWTKIIPVHVVSISIPLLVGLDTLDYHGWNVLTVQNLMQSVREKWSLNLHRIYGPFFLRWPSNFLVHYARQEFTKMHLHFMHPSSSKLFSLLHRAYLSKVEGDTLEILTDITKSCHICQSYSPGPLSFSVRFPNEAVFNKRITMDLMHLGSDPVLHIVDTGTNFSAAKFILNASTANMWETSVIIWVNVYTGYPSHIHIDQGSAFNSIELVQLCRNASM